MWRRLWGRCPLLGSLEFVFLRRILLWCFYVCFLVVRPDPACVEGRGRDPRRLGVFSLGVFGYLSVLRGPGGGSRVVNGEGGGGREGTGPPSLRLHFSLRSRSIPSSSFFPATQSPAKISPFMCESIKALSLSTSAIGLRRLPESASSLEVLHSVSSPATLGGWGGLSLRSTSGRPRAPPA